MQEQHETTDAQAVRFCISSLILALSQRSRMQGLTPALNIFPEHGLSMGQRNKHWDGVKGGFIILGCTTGTTTHDLAYSL